MIQLMSLVRKSCPLDKIMDQCSVIDCCLWCFLVGLQSSMKICYILSYKANHFVPISLPHENSCHVAIQVLKIHTSPIFVSK